jgi:hypothetical protein
MTAKAEKALMMKSNMTKKKTIAYQNHESDQQLLPPGSDRCDPAETMRIKVATSGPSIAHNMRR